MMYTVLFILTALSSYILLLVIPKTFLPDADGNVDGISQIYPIYTEIKRLVGNLLTGHGWSSWSWDIGLGDDSFINFNAKLLNPLTLIVIAFPQKYMDIGFNIMVIISQYLGGLAFMYFGHEMKLDDRQTVIGAICYTFSGWALWSLVHMATFLMATIMLPLIILGTERVLRKQSPVLFMIAVGMHLLYSFQWSYVAGIIVVLYFPIRYLTEYADSDKDEGRSVPKELGLRFLGFCGYGIVGIMMAMVVLIQNLFKMTGATTRTTVKNEILYSLKQYINVPAGLFSIDQSTVKYTVITLASVCVVLVPIAVKRIKQKDTAAIMTVGLFALSLIPFTGRVFNGLSYSSGRWFYVLSFFATWMCMEVYQESTFTRHNVKVMTLWTLGLGIWGTVIAGLIFKTASRANIVATLLGTAIALAFLYVVYVKKALVRDHNKYEALATLLIVMSIAAYSNTMLCPGLGGYFFELRRVGSVEDVFSTSTQKASVKLQNQDKSLYRTDQVDGYSDTRIARVRANENMYFGERSIYEYSSTIDSSWLYFNKVMGNNAGYFDRTTSYSNDNREGLDFLMGVKYFLGDNETKKDGASDYAGYGFSDYETIDGVEVLKNKYCMGIGTTFDKYITESELLEYPYLEREQVLLQAAVVSDDQDKSELKGLHHASKSEIKTDVKEISYTINGEKNASVDEKNKKITVTGSKSDSSSFNIKIPKVKNSRIVVSFDNFTKEELGLDDTLKLEGTTYSGNALAHAVNSVSYDDNDKFMVQLTKGNVVKAAQVRKGKTQGLDDVKDLNINLGYYDEISGNIKVHIDTKGVYDYDSIHVYVVPMDIYDDSAKTLENNRLKITSWSDDDIKGTITSDEDSIMYFSILNKRGWDIYVDGEKIDRLDRVNLTFMGAKLTSGKHNIELRYHTPGVKIGLAVSLLGITICVFIAIKRRRVV